MSHAVAAPLGRPRSAAVDRAVLKAAFDLFIEHGADGASIERIARRAGVSKTSIYRRWASRDALLAQAIEAVRNKLAPTTEMVERASPEGFLQLVAEDAGVLAQPQIRTLLARLIGSIPDRPQLFQAYRETYYAPRRRAIIGALRRAQDAGLLPPADLDIVADLLLGALIYRLLLAGDPAPSPRAYALAMLRQLGFAAGEAAGLDDSDFPPER